MGSLTELACENGSARYSCFIPQPRVVFVDASSVHIDAAVLPGTTFIFNDASHILKHENARSLSVNGNLIIDKLTN